MLGAANSNTTIMPAPGSGSGEVTVSGAVRLQPAWTPAQPLPGQQLGAGVALIKTALPATVKLEVLEAFANATTRLVAARYPNGNPELDQSNYQLHAAAWLPARDFGVAALHADSNYTRPGSFGKYSVGVGGPAANFAGNLSYWAQPHPGGGGASTYSIMSGVAVHTGPGQVPALRQGGAGGGYVFMMQTGSWGSWVFSIGNSTINPGTNTTNLTFAAGGFQEARGTGSPSRGGGSFYLSHLRELLDTVGEFWHDTEQQELYLAVPRQTSTSTSTSMQAAAVGPRELFLPQVHEIFRLEGTKAAPVVGAALGSSHLLLGMQTPFPGPRKQSKSPVRFH